MRSVESKSKEELSIEQVESPVIMPDDEDDLEYSPSKDRPDSILNESNAENV